MLLALSRETADFSIGSSLSLTGADRLATLAETHGFEPAAPQWYGTLVTEDELDRFAAHVRGQSDWGHAVNQLGRDHRHISAAAG